MKIPDEIKKYMTNDSGYKLVRLDQHGTAGKSFRIKNGKISRIRFENKIWDRNGKVGSTNHTSGKPEKKVLTEYVGEWKDGLKHGQGEWTYSNGSIKETYVGEWKDGQKHGLGKITYTDGSKGVREIYVGEWKNDQRDGLGKMINTTGLIQEIYVGKWAKNNRCGLGKTIYITEQRDTTI